MSRFLQPYMEDEDDLSLSSSDEYFEYDLEVDPQPTESTSRMSRFLQVEMEALEQMRSRCRAELRRVEVDPQPTESTSRMSRFLQVEMEILEQEICSLIAELRRVEADPQPTESTSSMSGFLQVETRSFPFDQPDMEADPRPTGLSSSCGHFRHDMGIQSMSSHMRKYEK